jgi:predicted MPP superfamily phosphohydrolase
VYGWRIARRPVLKRVEVPIARLGKALEGLRIVQLTDVHIGRHLGRDFLAKVVERVNALSPDVVAITGDLVDDDPEWTLPELAPLAELKAREGVFFVTGNHEYYHGGSYWEDAVRRLGVTVLHNEHRVIRRGEDALVIAGVTDLQGGQFEPDAVCRPDVALSGAPEGAPRILLAHQPRAAAKAQGLGVDLQLSGHTHGGQVFPFMFLVWLQQPALSGLKRLSGTWVYTSRGTGYWGPPLRVGAPPEITEIRLTASASASA